MLLNRIEYLSNLLTERIISSSQDLLNRYPISTYINYIESYPRISHYSYVSPEVEKYCRQIQECSNEVVLSEYHKLLLVGLIAHNMDRVNAGEYPEDVKTLFFGRFESILENIAQNIYGPEFYKYPRDKFLKELGIASLRIIPAGAELINVCALPRRWLIKKGISQFIRGNLFVLFRVKGFKPLYYFHMDSSDPNLMDEFNYEGWRRFYRRVAALLEVNKDIKGICSVPWFLDPQLESISPRLSYLRRFFTQNGGRVFYSGSDNNGISSAIAKSPTRRRLYQEGKYMPTNYIGIWPRKQLIEWARKNRESISSDVSKETPVRLSFSAQQKG